jgi:hypothetical protein
MEFVIDYIPVSGERKEQSCSHQSRRSGPAGLLANPARQQFQRQ